MGTLTSPVNDIIRIVETNEAAISHHEAEGVVGRFYTTGNHRLVFDLKAYPNYIIKIDSSGANQKVIFDAIEKGRAVVKNENLNRCFVPESTMITKDGKTIWIEQKLAGIFNPYDAGRKSEEQYENLSKDSDLMQKWQDTFGQAADFVAGTGYGDIDWRNILLMDEGFGFIDFEEVVLNPSKVANSLYCLLCMAPVEAFDRIFDVVEKHRLERNFLVFVSIMLPPDKSFTKEMSFRDKMEIIKQIRREELDRNAKIRLHHRLKNITNLTDRVDPTGYDLGSTERKIIDKFNSKIAGPSQYCSGNPVEVRKLLWQPLRENIAKNEFDRALKQLENDGVIATWSVRSNPNNSILDEYNIYF